MSLYEGEYPVPDEWVEEHIEDGEVSFRFVMTLDDFIEAQDMDGINDFMDSVLSMRKATLADLSYRFVDIHPRRSI